MTFRRSFFGYKMGNDDEVKGGATGTNTVTPKLLRDVMKNTTDSMTAALKALPRLLVDALAAQR